MKIQLLKEAYIDHTIYPVYTEIDVDDAIAKRLIEANHAIVFTEAEEQKGVKVNINVNLIDNQTKAKKSKKVSGV